MNNTDLIKVFLSMFLMNLPTLLVCLVAGVVILVKWRQGGAASFWALLGFGLLLALCLVVPLAQAALQHWVFQDGLRASRTWAFSAFSIVASFLHAGIYILLLAAIFAGRLKSA